MVPKSKLNRMFYLEEGSAPTPTGPPPHPCGWLTSWRLVYSSCIFSRNKQMDVYFSYFPVFSFTCSSMSTHSPFFSLTIYPKVTPHKFIWRFLGQVYTIPCFLHILHLDLWCIWSLFLWMVWSGEQILSCSKWLPSCPVHGKGDFVPPAVWDATFMIQSLELVWTVSFFH